MRIFNIIENTRVEGPGLRTAIWFQGCNILCPGCFNKQMQEINAGHEISVEDIMQILLKNSDITGVTIAGGEPMLQAEELKKLLLHIRYRTPSLDILLYTGLCASQIAKKAIYKSCCAIADIIISGPFIKALSPDPRRWVGSTNQEIFYISDTMREQLSPWPVEDHKSEIIIGDKSIVACGNETGLL